MRNPRRDKQGQAGKTGDFEVATSEKYENKQGEKLWENEQIHRTSGKRA